MTTILMMLVLGMPVDTYYEQCCNYSGYCKPVPKGQCIYR